MSRLLSAFLAELRRRRVLRSLSLYAGGAWIVISLCDVALPFVDAPTWVMDLVIWAALSGLPIAGILSWFWQVVPDASSASIRAPRAKAPWDVALIAVLLSALTVSVYLNLTGSAAPEKDSRRPQVKSLAVLPFSDLSPLGDQRFLVDGLAEELLNILTRNPEVQAVGRTSSFSFKTQDLAIPEIARQLDVAYLVEGSVRRDGDRVRVSVKLVSGRDGYQLWGNTYDDTFDSLFEIQRRIARRIAAALDVGILSGNGPILTTSTQAYVAYLQASDLARQGSADTLEQAAALFEQSVALDPGYAPAWSRLASVYGNLAGQGHRDYDGTFSLARQAAERAISEGPEYAGGYVQLAWIEHRHAGNLPAAAEAMQQALVLDSHNVSTLRGAATLLLQLGRVSEAVRVLEHCARRSPLDPQVLFNLGVAQKYAGDFDGSMKSFDTVLSLSPDYNGVGYQAAEVHLLQGRSAEARALFETLPGYRGTVGQALTSFQLGNREASDAALDALKQGWGEIWPGTIADVHAYRGELDEAFAWLEKDVAQFGAAGWGELKLQRLLDNLKSDPRWFALLERVNASDRQLDAIDLNVASLN